MEKRTVQGEARASHTFLPRLLAVFTRRRMSIESLQLETLPSQRDVQFSVTITASEEEAGKLVSQIRKIFDVQSIEFFTTP